MNWVGGWKKRRRRRRRRVTSCLFGVVRVVGGWVGGFTCGWVDVKGPSRHVHDRHDLLDEWDEAEIGGWLEWVGGWVGGWLNDQFLY